MNTLNFIFNSESLNIYGSTSDPYFVVNDVCRLIGIDAKTSLPKRIKKNPKFGNGGL